MKAIVNTGPGRLEWTDLPLPDPGPGQVRIRTGACAICATDLEVVNGTNRTSFPCVPGHEWSGVVDAVGPEVESVTPGQRCVGDNILAGGGEIGFEYPGGYAECFLTEADQLYPLPDGYPFENAALIEPLAVCLRGIKRLGADIVGPALILGDGPIGLLMTRLLADMGVRPICVVGGRQARLSLALAFGAVCALDYRDSETDLVAFARDGTLPAFSVSVEATGTAEGAATAVDLVMKQGRVLLMGDYGAHCAKFSWLDLVHRELELLGSNTGAEVWPQAVRLAVEDHVPLDALISHQFPAREFEQAFALARGGADDVVKIVLTWDA